MLNIDFIIENLDSSSYQTCNLELYSSIENKKDVKSFMENHIFAIWDYMSLMRALENNLRDNSVPWFPSNNGKNLKILYKILDEEEYTIDASGSVKSYFEMYLEAMEEIGANTSDILNILSHSKTINLIDEALNLTGMNIESFYYTRFIYTIIKSQKPHLMAIVFALSKELVSKVLILEDFCRKDFSNKYDKTLFLINKLKAVNSKNYNSNAFKLASDFIGEDPQKLMEAKRAALNCVRYRDLHIEGIARSIQKQKAVYFHEANC
ncbi:DUF3050 domain-containing protein [Polaribacter dokdonensis]|uniref:Uncharacterized protein n=1 Tax=Polaribacter dokdonensis DSW-5 TaxID=1300348 RepID=A0A0M9CG01_9FLAO|nr:DUF3050 domain-containing protein [Polaribacter dokdonensis]KOY51772.1 hypothetical protein I602_1332 [Polaribacter dokdonensis DSW-5]SEE03531.1 Protein of unknown function [Polaribacter dokdonensis DSW-5]